MPLQHAPQDTYGADGTVDRNDDDNLVQWQSPGEGHVGHSRTQPVDRTLGLATRFVEDVRADIARAVLQGEDIPPRLRCVNYRAGHATPEFRTLSIPSPGGPGTLTPALLSAVIAQYAEERSPDCLLLAMEAEMPVDGRACTVLITEARDRAGTRLFRVQPFRPGGARMVWEAPLEGGWRDPGGEEMILDAAFAGAAAAAIAALTAPSADLGTAAGAGGV
jgi:hypothetical protein